MNTVLFMLIAIVVAIAPSAAFAPSKMNTRRILNSDSVMKMSVHDDISSLSGFIFSGSLPLADTSISEEDVLNVSGQVANLPDPLVAIGIAAVIFLGVAVLQFSLGDITREEGQARVRDFLQSKRDTERKRGYFD